MSPTSRRANPRIAAWCATYACSTASRSPARSSRDEIVVLSGLATIAGSVITLAVTCFMVPGRRRTVQSNRHGSVIFGSSAGAIKSTMLPMTCATSLPVSAAILLGRRVAIEVRAVADPDLDQLVIGERLIDGLDQALVEAAFADLHDRVELVARARADGDAAYQSTWSLLLTRASAMKITGTRNSDSSVDDVSPPTTASASGRFASAPRSSPIAVGMRPITVASEVIAIGTNRVRAASRIAARLSRPSSSFDARVIDQQDAVRHRDADDHQHAHQRGDREPHAAREQREHDADQRARDREQHDERHPQRLELRRHDHEHDHDREPDAEAEARERRRASAGPDRRSRT